MKTVDKIVNFLGNSSRTGWGGGKNKSLAKRLVDMERSIMSNLETKYYVRKYDKKHKKFAGGYELTAEQKHEVANVFKVYGGVKYYSHAFYTKVTGSFSPYYIPDGFYYAYIDHYYNNWKKAIWIDNKCNYHKLLPGIPQPEMICYRINSYWYDANHEYIGTMIPARLIERHEAIFIKRATQSSGGAGVNFLSLKNGEDYQSYLSCPQEDMVVQIPLKQSSEIGRLSPSSVNTVRILSLLRRNGEVKICSTIIRMGVGTSKVDNACSGGINCGVNIDGRLKSVAFTTMGERFDEHPTTHTHFDTVVIPNYDKVLALVKRAHRLLPEFRLLSWDIAINKDDEPVLIEVNLQYGELDFHQINNGPVFGDDTEEILNEVFSQI